MRRHLILIFVYIFSNFNCQNLDYSGINASAPSASLIANYINSPVSISTGIPDISFNFFSLPTHSKYLQINAGMSYHPNNTFFGTKSSVIGKGWSLNGVDSFIYREVDESNGQPTDRYYFNIFGRTGKFTASGQKITENKLNISLQSNGPGLSKFLITDENGLKYYFDVLDISYYKNIYNTYTNFTGAYYLSKVVDAGGVELINCEYLEDNYTVGHNVFQKPVKSLRLKKINALNFGSLNLNYTLDPLYRVGIIDPFTLTTIELKSISGKMIKKFGFQSNFSNMLYPYDDPLWPYESCANMTFPNRILTRMHEFDNNNVSKFTDFYYAGGFEETPLTNIFGDPKNCFKNEIENPNHLGKLLLARIDYPNGTRIRYTYELNQYYQDKNTTDYLHTYAPPDEVKDRQVQYYEDVIEIPFDSCVPGSGSFILPANPDDADGASYLVHEVQVDQYYTGCPFSIGTGDPYMSFHIVNGTPTNYLFSTKVNAGTVNYNISTSGAKGKVLVKRIRYISKPLPNYNTGHSVRIKKIEKFDQSNLIDTETIHFEYQKFDNPDMTSGFLNEFDNTASVVYKNVKVKKGNDQGYEKYYYRAVDDHPDNMITINNLKVSKNGLNLTLDSTAVSSMTLNFLNILKNGLLYKKEVYNKDHQIIKKDSSSFVINQIFDLYTVPTGYNTTDGLGVLQGKNGIIREQTNISTLYTPTGSYTESSWIKRDIVDYNVTSRKTIGTDGNTIEELYTLPYQYRTINPKLWNAHIKDIPLIVETKRNGTVVSKTETKFENASHFYPTSQISFLPDNLSQSLQNVSYDIYDDKGNLVQFTAFPEVGSAGVPTTIIYGYNKTMPIAKIEGAKLSDIPSSLITAIVNASNDDANAPAAQEEAKEQALIAALNTFKNDAALENFMVTCYTYNPLVGITTTIPPNGMMELYKYDSFNRLLKVVDVNGNTVKEHQYNYKQ